MTEPQSKGAANPTQAFEVLRRAAVAPSPFVQVLLSCLERRATGSLSVMLSGRGRLWVRLEGGFPTAVAGDGVAESVQQTLLPLCTLQQGGYAFQEGEDRVALTPGMLRGPVDPHALLAEAFRHPSRAALVQRQVSLSDVRLLAVARGVNLARYRFSDEERRVADRLLVGPTSVPTLAAERDLNASVVRRVVYVLELTGALLDLKARDESGERPRSSRPPAPDADGGDPRASYARPKSPRTPLPEAEPTTGQQARVLGRVRNATMPFGALPTPAQLPPGALPPPSPSTAPGPGPSPARSEVSVHGASEPRARMHPIATPPARRKLRSPAGGYSVARPEHGEHTMEAPRARKESAMRETLSSTRNEAASPPSSPNARPLSLPMPAVGLSAVHRGRWHEVLDRYRRLHVEDHFLALGVPRTVDSGRLDVAFRTETARFQPSHLPPELSPVRPHAEAIVAALHRAYDALRDPGRRQAYLRKLSAQR